METLAEIDTTVVHIASRHVSNDGGVNLVVGLDQQPHCGNFEGAQQLSRSGMQLFDRRVADHDGAYGARDLGDERILDAVDGPQRLFYFAWVDGGPAGPSKRDIACDGTFRDASRTPAGTDVA